MKIRIIAFHFRELPATTNFFVTELIYATVQEIATTAEIHALAARNAITFAMNKMIIVVLHLEFNAMMVFSVLQQILAMVQDRVLELEVLALLLNAIIFAVNRMIIASMHIILLALLIRTNARATSVTDQVTALIH